ncbi:hypothetical protein FRX31_031858 [Thalictrum thalictroides]|uniref:FAS1 domain-containing protein n=1 Tax=Thalictrum thalictroides TaxID=46969 RepID=A0A7J6V167_THATH|nr:hypothetical protein FRX31_031858 [Thalictrum thalictroides]
MASKIQFLFLLFLSIFSCLPIASTSGDHLGDIVKSVSDAGYKAMSLTLELTLPTLISSALADNNSITAITIFCPPDEAFRSLEHFRQPPLTLLKYHIAPVKLERKDLEPVLPLGIKINTLLHGHPIVETTSSITGNPSINGVEIKQWNIYNDGHVIVHGVENFFDPGYQTILYPMYDGEVLKDSNNSNMITIKALGQIVFVLVFMVVPAMILGIRYLSQKQKR